MSVISSIICINAQMKRSDCTSREISVTALPKQLRTYVSMVTSYRFRHDADSSHCQCVLSEVMTWHCNARTLTLKLASAQCNMITCPQLGLGHGSIRQ
jgi:hypothetical protein